MSTAKLAFATLILVGSMARADDLKTIESPGGGQVVYGHLTGVTSLQSAMGYALKSVHGHYGERPLVGKFFQSDSHSVATFFTLHAKTPGGGTKPVSGLVVISMPPGSQPAVAVLTDDSARFPKTGPVMMQRLSDAWRSAANDSPSGAASGEASAESASSTARGGAGSARPLHMSTGGDRSAAIGIAAGWRLMSVAGGMVQVAGPKGEEVYLGLIYQQINDQPTRGFGKGGSAPLVFPRSGDLFSAYVSIINQSRRNARQSQATLRLVSQKSLPPSQYEQRVIEAALEVDLHDGKGLRKGTARIGAMYTRGVPFWAMTLSGSNAPATDSESDLYTMKAMIASYSQDAKVIAGQTHAVVERIHDESRIAQQRLDAHNAANDQSKRNFENHMKAIDANSHAFAAHNDDLDRYAKSFQNYQLDRTQIQDNDRNERGTADNNAAELLMKVDPNRFQVVPTQDFIKGVDY